MAQQGRTRRNLWIGTGAILGIGALLSWPTLLGSALETQGYMPHGHCYLWQPGLVGLHVVSDALIALAYLSISGTLVFLVYRARNEIPFTWMFLAFGAFILACGATHMMEVWTLWVPSYWASGNVKLVTAVASVTTAVLLPPLVPRVLQLVQAENLAENRGRQLVEAEERASLAASAQAARRDAEEARREAESANRAKDQFLATVSHELRNPLGPILSWSQLLRSGALDEATTREAIESIERCALAQTQIIDDLLDVSRIISGKFRMDVRPLELPQVIDSAIGAARLSADAKQIQLQVITDGGSGPVAGDPDRLQQVVWNLLSNAVKATPRGGHIRVQLSRIESHVELSVSDDGAGIEAALLPHLFERFIQGESGTTRQHGGLGLGLAIVRHIVELHGGRVEAESPGRGQGAVFRVMLPILPTVPRDYEDQARRHPSAPAPFPAPPSDFADLTGIRVLVVDDDPDSNVAVHALLTHCGAEVRATTSAAEAFETFATWRPDVLVSDIGMPVEDGYSLIARIRQRAAAEGGSIPALALSAYARTDDRVRALEAGFQLHLAKPADPAELAAAVARLAQRER